MASPKSSRPPGTSIFWSTMWVSSKSRTRSRFPTRTGSGYSPSMFSRGVRFTRHYGPRMRDKGFGRIIFISSESGVQIPTEMIHYGFTKAADLALMRGFAQALAASGVTVNAVLPGPTRTEGVEAMFKSMGQSADDPEGRARLHRKRAAQLDHQTAGQARRSGRGGRLLVLTRSKRHYRLAGAGRWRRGHVDHVSRRGPDRADDGRSPMRRGRLEPHHWTLALGVLARDLHQRLAVEDHLAIDLAEARQARPRFFRDQLGHGHVTTTVSPILTGARKFSVCEI